MLTHSAQRALPILAVLCLVAAARADISDFTNWTLVEDPPATHLNASLTASQAFLFAGPGAVSAGADIGYQSVNGLTPAASTLGYKFSPAADFTIAVNFDLSFTNSPSGVLGLGFGIGEDGDGANSAGVVMATLHGAPLVNFSGAARVNDVDQGIQSTGLAAMLTGSLFVSYDAASGDVTVGATPTLDAVAPTGTTTFAGIQHAWAGGDLLASLFIRSDLTGWAGGEAQAIFSNFRVLQGAAVLVPEPMTGVLFAAALLAAPRRRRNR